MFLFGHTGITVLVAYAAERIQARRSPEAVGLSVAEVPNGNSSLNTSGSRHFVPTGRGAIKVDYRLVVLGAILPDIIDKPLALWIWPDVFQATRTIGHSALFVAFLISIGCLALIMKHSRGPMVLALASAGHLLLDTIWRASAQVLWWPFYGLHWAESPGRSDVWKSWVSPLYSDPGVYVAELIGIGLLLTVGVLLLRKTRSAQRIRGRGARHGSRSTPP